MMRVVSKKLLGKVISGSLEYPSGIYIIVELTYSAAAFRNPAGAVR